MYFRQPRYYDKFQCIGGECSASCCFGWNIWWSREEIDKVLNAENISPELKKLAEESFEYHEDRGAYKTKLIEGRQCVFHDADGLCMIQKELGAEYLSDICINYPRNMIAANDVGYRFFRTACPVIMKQLLNDKSSMSLMNFTPKQTLYIKLTAMNGLNYLKTRPEQKFRTEIFEFFYELISDKDLEVERAIMLGSIAADELAKTIAREDYDYIPQQLKTPRNQLRERSLVDGVNAIEPNHSIKLTALPMFCEELIGAASTVYIHDNDGNILLEKYQHGYEALKETLKNRPYFLRNLALQLLFDIDVPFKFPDRSLFENYGLFATAFGCLKLNMEAALSTDGAVEMEVGGTRVFYNGTDEKITAMTAILSRGICQSDRIAQQMIEELNAQNFMDHGHLAAFIL